MNEFEKYAVNHIGINSMTMHDYKSHMGPVMPTSMSPMVIEERQMNAVAMSVFDRLMMDRIIFLGTGINDQVANIINAQLLFLQSVDSKKDISMYINTGGGGVFAGESILDCMDFIAPDISTVVMGLAASMGFVIAVHGAKGKRMALKHSRLMQHQPMGGASGQSSDIQIVAKEIDKLKRELYEIISEDTGQDIEKIYEDADRDYWMTAEEAKDYGAIDKVIGKKK